MIFVNSNSLLLAKLIVLTCLKLIASHAKLFIERLSIFSINRQIPGKYGKSYHPNLIKQIGLME